MLDLTMLHTTDSQHVPVRRGTRHILTVAWLALLTHNCLTHANKREVGCSAFNDLAWRFEDGRCPTGTRYHCFKNQHGGMEKEGCFTVKTCIRGSHPAVEGTVLVCAFCHTGFQPQASVASNEYLLSYCVPHRDPCDPQRGLTQCLPPSRQRDRACACNATLGFLPAPGGQSCPVCPSPSDTGCSACVFSGCPPGRVRNHRGFCEEENAKNRPAITPSDEGGSILPVWAISFIVVTIALGSLLLYIQRKHLLKAWKEGQCWGKKRPFTGDSQPLHCHEETYAPGGFPRENDMWPI